MMAKIELMNLEFSPEAYGAIQGFREKLKTFSKLIGRNEEPEIWAELLPNGDLKVNFKIATSKGQVTADVNIPADHWRWKGEKS